MKDFLLSGEQQGLPLRYKCSRRKIWYEVPLMKQTEGFFFKRSHHFPRLCINRASVLVTDTAYRVTMKDKHTIEGLCYSFYNSLTLLFAEIDGRFYGGGVLELTPSEFKGLPIVLSRRLKRASDEEKRAFESDDLRKRLIFDLVKKDPVKTRAEEKYTGFYKDSMVLMSWCYR